jgi:YesN/AraC family two-component response regulator
MRSIFAPFCGVVEARDGQEALDLCKKSIPDLIITDVMMPVVCHCCAAFG